MHELLAPFVWLCATDAAEAANPPPTLAPAAAAAGGTAEAAAVDGPRAAVLRSLLRPEDVESSSFVAFSSLMVSMISWFAPISRGSAGPLPSTEQATVPA